MSSNGHFILLRPLTARTLRKAGRASFLRTIRIPQPMSLATWLDLTIGILKITEILAHFLQ